MLPAVTATQSTLEAALHEQPAVVATATLPLPPASVNPCDAGAMAKEHTLDGSTGDLDDSHAHDETHTLPMPSAAYTMVVLPMSSSAHSLFIPGHCNARARAVSRLAAGTAIALW